MATTTTPRTIKSERSYRARRRLCLLSATALLSTLAATFADEGTSRPTPIFKPRPLFQPTNTTPRSVTVQFRLHTPAADTPSHPDTCSVESQSPELHPSTNPAEIHATWQTRPGVLYTVELSTDHQTWQPGPHLVGDGGIATYHLLEKFGAVGKSGLVRISAYPDPYEDPDGDGLDTITEVTATGTSPFDPDSDSDGLYDAYEFATGTDPASPTPTANPPTQGTSILVVHRPL